MSVESNLKALHERIILSCANFNRQLPTLITVSKGQTPHAINRAIACSQTHFGENRVLEAQAKWRPLKENFSNITLHLIGTLQTNKVKEAVATFDIIHTVDNLRLAQKIADECAKSGKNIACFIQVNIGKEAQKQGIPLDQADTFIESVRDHLKLNLVGLMCLPPFRVDPQPFFKHLQDIAAQHKLSSLSMGMSNDFESALQYGTTHLRIGSAIFEDSHTSKDI
jgi:pyridoxal phosphate enzyme (YggS family)